ncbi:Fis family transcriptional regulator [Thiohalorhabdus denitrificans]|uniref:Sigma54 specific transcriptional regulator, Fis family n=1 Tax=Thiohalorhabdus denitrificans TaxID=381306 RepID=A0A0P9CWR0_9GAMM|nr:sigma 54-interacting transcriptional regulator [Thiohalorhabdus denitrificans]KPV41218.1 Fis family transcriptional regulator [Thiohalorhabdus denitrificans]SCY63754.1 sigma54 specific transcriptional regulator, Fis family [Thiohalorhabdus denitrificans]
MKAPARSASPEPADLLNAFRQPAILLDRHYRIVAANPAYQGIYGEGEPLAQRHCYEVSHGYSRPCDETGEECPLKSSLERDAPSRVLHIHHTPAGKEHVDVEVHPLRNGSGEVTHFLEVLHQARTASPREDGPGLVGRSPAFNHMVELVERVAPAETAVLLLGESGTGKELVAKAVHEGSRRSGGPFVPVECSGLTESLFESELFGHVKGAFTGAHHQKTGLVEAAHQGTLFLDEVGDIPLSMQVKLLRLLETRTFRPVGGVEPRKTDFRLVCATHRNLEEMVAEGSFRADLFYRLSPFPIPLPPLRERPEDIPLLADALLRRMEQGRGHTLSETAVSCLQAYAFPGNVRELRNLLERATILADGAALLPEHFPGVCGRGLPGGRGEPWPHEILPLDEVEHRYLRWALARAGNDRKELAARLGISERTLYRKLRAARRGEA